MYRFLLFLFAVAISNVLFAQDERYRVAMDSFQVYYNAGNYLKIFNSFTAEMQQALPLEQTKSFLGNLLNSAGKMVSMEPIGEVKEVGANYKTRFEKTFLTVSVALDGEKIAGLYFKPWIEDSEQENRTRSAMNGFEKDVAELVFDKVKGFPNGTQLSIAVVDEGKTKYYGVLKENDLVRECNNERSIFEIGSVTKVFTSTVLASLVGENKIKLTDCINPYFPFEFKDGVLIRFVDLANHSSGLPRLPNNLDLSNELNPYQQYGRKELEDYLKHYLCVANDSSRRYLYSNLGAGLLGYSLGLCEHTSFDRLIQKRVFDKYRMRNSFLNSGGVKKGLVKGLDKNGKEVPNWDFNVLLGAGAALSCTSDLVKFVKAQFVMRNKELALTRVPSFEVNNQLKIGLGWHILSMPGGRSAVWHSGATGGYCCSLAVDVENRLAVIVLSNVSAFNPKMVHVDELCLEWMKGLERGEM